MISCNVWWVKWKFKKNTSGPYISLLQENKQKKVIIFLIIFEINPLSLGNEINTIRESETEKIFNVEVVSLLSAYVFCGKRLHVQDIIR